MPKKKLWVAADAQQREFQREYAEIPKPSNYCSSCGKKIEVGEPIYSVAGKTLCVNCYHSQRMEDKNSGRKML